jgi:hypothetical protein
VGAFLAASVKDMPVWTVASRRATVEKERGLRAIGIATPLAEALASTTTRSSSEVDDSISRSLKEIRDEGIDNSVCYYDNFSSAHLHWYLYRGKRDDNGHSMRGRLGGCQRAFLSRGLGLWIQTVFACLAS